MEYTDPEGLVCPKCGLDTVVLDSRRGRGYIRRRRRCKSKECDERFATREVPVPEHFHGLPDVKPPPDPRFRKIEQLAWSIIEAARPPEPEKTEDEEHH